MRHLDLADLVALAAEVSDVDTAKLLDLLDTAEVGAILAEARPPRPPHESAATVLAGLVAVSPLPSGNRRLAVLAALHLLALNGLEAALDAPAVLELFAAGADAGSVTAWLDGRVTARDPLEGPLRNRLAPDASRAIGFAGERARRHRRHHITAGDLLMGLFREGKGVAAQALGAGETEVVLARSQRQPLDADARKVLELALRSATTLAHANITGGHVLLGLLDAGHAGTLPDDLDPVDVRRRVLDLLGPGDSEDDDVPGRLTGLADRLHSIDPDAAAEVDEVADLLRLGLDRLIQMVRAWRGDVFLQALEQDATVAGLLGARRLHAGVPPAEDDDVLAGYLTAIAEYPKLSRSEELELAQSIRDDGRRLLIQSNLQLVVGLARRYEGRGVPLVDLIQEGNIGLMRAAERYDPTKGYRFATFATWWIRRAIDEAIVRHQGIPPTAGG
jgi:hypothetical protein